MYTLIKIKDSLHAHPRLRKKSIPVVPFKDISSELSLPDQLLLQGVVNTYT